MSFGTSWTLGSAVTLPLGLRPVLPAAGDPFFHPANQPITTDAAALGQDPGTWRDPVITLHPTPESLLSALFDIRVRFESDEQPASSVGAGALLLNDADRREVLASLRESLGIDFSLPDHGYALVALRRDAGTVVHRSRERGVFGIPDRPAMVTEKFDRVASRLRPCLSPARPAPDRAAAQLYLDVFRAWGTHYVSQVWGGDVIYQVLSYKADRFAVLQAALQSSPESFSGPWAAFGFSYYTRPRHGAFGDVEQRSPVRILSADPAFAASVAAGDWRDDQWAKADSVLAPALTRKADLSAFTRVVPVAVELSSLGLFIEYYRKITWRRVCMAALYRKYGDSIQPGFVQAADPLAARLYGGEGELLSTIASPTISLFRKRFAPAGMQLVAADGIRDLTVVSDLLEIPGDAALPGPSVTLLAHQVIAGAATPGVPRLTLSDEAFAADRLWCRRFDGALRVTAATGKAWTLIADGVRYDTRADADSGRPWVAAVRDVCAAPPAEVLPGLGLLLQFAQVANEALWQVNQVAPVDGARARILDLFDWLATIIPASAEDEALARTRLSALYLCRAAGTLADAARRVPYLTYDAYRDLVQSVIAVADDITRTTQDYQNQLRERRRAEQLMDIATTLNQNIVASGTLLADYIAASARQQSQLAEFQASIVAQDDQAIAKSAASMQELDRLFTEQQMEVDKAVEHYQTAVADWETNEIIKFSLDLCVNVFSAGFTMITPIGPAKEGVVELSQTAKKIQKLVKTIEAITKVMTTIQGGVKNIRQAQAALEAVNGGDDDTLSALEWNEFRSNMKLALANGPAVAEKNTLDTAFDILVQRAQARLNAQANAKKQLGERLLALQHQQMNQDQADRLDRIAATFKQQQLDPQALAGIDLVGLTGELEAQKRQMVLTLAQTLMIQDQALQYEYLQEPLALPSLDLLALKAAIVRQHTATVKALELLSPPPQALAEPVDYVIEGVPVAALVDGSSFRFTIPLSAREFSPYTMVRVRDVTLYVDGVSGSTGGKTVSRLLYLGAPFEDRNQNRDALVFGTVSRRFDYLTDLATGKVVYGGSEAAAGTISRITPFSDWEVSFPKVASNAGLAFAGPTVTVRLSFHLVAQLNNGPVRLRAGAGSSRTATLEAMKNRSVTKGWDVVLSLTETKINALFEQQYNDRKNNPHFVREIPETTRDYTDPTTGTTTRTIFSMKLGAPKIAFLNNNSQYADVTMAVTGGSYAYGVVAGDTFVPITRIPDLSNNTLKAQVALEKMQGDVATTFKVVVNLAKGTFSADMFEITTTNPMFNAFISKYFADLRTTYELGALDMTRYGVLDALKPRQFLFNVLRTNSQKDLLQLFITTDGTQKTTKGVDIAEPVPDGDDCSLIVSSRVFFDKVMPASLAAGGSFLTLGGVDPGNDYTLWSDRVTRGTLDAVFTSTDSNIRISGSSNRVPIDFTGMTITSSAGSAELSISYAKTEKRGFEYYAEHCHAVPGGGGDISCVNSWDYHTLDVSVNLTSTMPISVGGSGQNQQIMIDSREANVTVGGNLSPAGACTTSDRELQSAFLDQLRTQLPPAIRKALKVEFQAVSLFALKNLLFPADNIITFNAAYVPGDLIVFGSISDHLR